VADFDPHTEQQRPNSGSRQGRSPDHVFRRTHLRPRGPRALPALLRGDRSEMTLAKGVSGSRGRGRWRVAPIRTFPGVSDARCGRRITYLCGWIGIRRCCSGSICTGFRSNTRRIIKWLDRACGERRSEIVHDAIELSGYSRLTIDSDGSVLRSGFRFEGAEHRYNPSQS